MKCIERIQKYYPSAETYRTDTSCGRIIIGLKRVTSVIGQLEKWQNETEIC